MTGLEAGDDSGESKSVRKRAVLLALRCYCGELRRQWPVALPAMTLPAMGNRSEEVV